MLRRNIPRFLLQVGLLIAAASIAAALHLSAAAIVLVMAAAFALVVVGEWLAPRESSKTLALPPPAVAAEPEIRPAPVWPSGP